MLIYKVFTAEEWAQLRAEGHSAGAPVDLADGYVHFSTGAQLQGTLNKHFAGRDGLVLLACDSAAMGDALRWEPSRGGADFPHLYRELRIADVLWHRPIATDAQDHHDPGDLS